MRKILTTMMTGVLVLCVAGCSVQKDYVAADDLTYKVIAEDWLKRCDADPSISQAEKDRHHRTVATWRLRIDKNK
jgi:hypothetical protein